MRPLTKLQLKALIIAREDGQVRYGPGTKMGSRSRPTIASLVKKGLLKPYQHDTRTCFITADGINQLVDELTPPV